MDGLCVTEGEIHVTCRGKHVTGGEMGEGISHLYVILNVSLFSFLSFFLAFSVMEDEFG